MGGRFNNPFLSEHKEPVFTLDIHDSARVSDGKMAPAPSPKRSKRAMQKRVVSVPMEVDASRLKGEGAPPSDSWAWRKYGQKPIKGSPYPRGYYRCSSSKGCPARKQVERSRVDPTMLVITYACEHNHSGPASKATSNPITRSQAHDTSPLHEPETFPTHSDPEPDPEPEPEHEAQFSDLVDGPLITSDDFSWFSDVPSTSPTVFDNPIYTGNNHDADVAMIFQIKEEDESFFADLGELPECSMVFRREFMAKEEESRRCNLRSSLCESTG